MKYNNLKSLVFGSVFALGLCSCGDFLYIEPKTFVSEDNFWNEKTDIEQMVMGAYTKLQSSGVMERCIMWGETRSDNITISTTVQKDQAVYRTLKENLLPTNRFTDWSSFYAVINHCNTVIEKAPEVSAKDPSYLESDVLATQAEMSAIRDLCYFYLVRAFEDVPFTMKAVQAESDVQSLAPTKGDEIVKALIKDLEGVVHNAMKVYPKDNSSRNYDSNCNRITQNAIYAMLTDMCLWMGSGCQDDESLRTSYYQKAVDYAQVVIDSKKAEYKKDYAASTMSSSSLQVVKHKLDVMNTAASSVEGVDGFPLYCNGTKGGATGDPAAVFSAIFGGNQNSFESIFELAFTKTSPDDSNYAGNPAVGNLYGNHYTKDGNAGEGLLAVNELIVADLFNSTPNIYTNKDDARFFTDIYNAKLTEDEKKFGYISKYVYTDRSVTTADKGTLKTAVLSSAKVYDDRNWIFYRLTDVMLMQAEALTELGSQEELTRAFYIVWAVNRRSMMKNYQLGNEDGLLRNSYTQQSKCRELVLDERRRELMFEGKRWFDLLRQCRREGGTSYLQSKVTAKDGTSAKLFVNPASLYWPYNKREVINNKHLNQKSFYGAEENNGYESTAK